MALLTHLLTLIFGTSSWMAVNGAWVELPLLVNQLPEAWYLPAYIMIIVQFANIAPLSITVLHKLKPGLLREVPANYMVVSIGTVASFLLAFLWHRTTYVAGQLHSTAFFILIFFLSLVDCASSITFLPFMARFDSRYVTTFFIGVGLSGFVPSIVALVQGSGDGHCVHVPIGTHNRTASNTSTGNWTAEEAPFKVVTRYTPANFSPMVFFIIMAVTSLVCLVAFFFLNRIPRVWELSEQKLRASKVTLNSIQRIPADGKPPGPIAAFSNFAIDGKSDSSSKEALAVDPGKKSPFTPSKLAYIYFLLAWTNLLASGALPSVQSYSCLPYSNKAFHLSVTLSNLANPLACIIAMFFPSRYSAFSMRRVCLSPAK